MSFFPLFPHSPPLPTCLLHMHALARYIAPAAYVHPFIRSRYQPFTPISVSFSFSQAYPDVSAQSNRFFIYFQGIKVLISGTSAAAPTFAGIVALLNDASIAAGKSSLGFLNPMLYSIGTAGLRDITQGNAPGCGTQGFNVRSPSLFSFFGCACIDCR